LGLLPRIHEQHRRHRRDLLGTDDRHDVNLPGLPPNGDPRTPDIVITPNVGVIYTGKKKKVMEHGGFARDDTNVIMLLVNPALASATVTSPVETAQIAPTILKALGLDPHSLKAVRIEHTQALPGFRLHVN
jgi:hypothetical protein